MNETVGLYIHWPYCRSKCPYCDFNSHAISNFDAPRWLEGFRRALTDARAMTPGRGIGSIFFGGGTPSLMPPDMVSGLIGDVRSLWPVEDAVEITLEANPSAAEASRFSALRRAGVTRLSIGVQAFDDATLEFLGRTHDAAQARYAIDAAIKTFPEVSIDLMFGWRGHTARSWEQTLAEATGFGTRHISIYQLTVEAGTRFAAHGVRTVEADASGDLYALATERLGANGFEAYEVSNFARGSAVCGHNLAVWRGGEYIGIGPGAHGRIRRNGNWLAMVQEHLPEAWLAATEARLGVEDRTVLAASERAMEIVMTGLRLQEGFDRMALWRLCGLDAADVLAEDALKTLVDGGLLGSNGPRIWATPAGRLVLDSMIPRLLV